MNKRKIILMFLATSVILSCGKEYRFNTNWGFDTGNDTAVVKFQFKSHVYVSAGEYLNTGSPNHLLYCLEIKNGKVKWKLDIGAGIIIHKMSLVKNIIFLKTLNNKEIYLDALTGENLRNKPHSSISESTPYHAFNGKKVVAIAGDEEAGKPARIDCVNSAGKTVWSYQVAPLLHVKEPYEVNFSFIMDGSNLILATYDGKVKSIAVQ